LRDSLIENLTSDLLAHFMLFHSFRYFEVNYASIFPTCDQLLTLDEENYASLAMILTKFW